MTVMRVVGTALEVKTCSNTDRKVGKPVVGPVFGSARLIYNATSNFLSFPYIIAAPIEFSYLWLNNLS